MLHECLLRRKLIIVRGRIEESTALAPGTRLGPYEIISPLGAGGMGEVYRAKDTRLDRIVAIKVLPSHLSSNSDLRQRFEREARALKMRVETVPILEVPIPGSR